MTLRDDASSIYKSCIKNLNPSKRPISAVADNYEVRNAKTISIKTNNKIKFNLFYTFNSHIIFDNSYYII